MTEKQVRLYFFKLPIVLSAILVIWFLYVVLPKPKYSVSSKIEGVSINIKIVDKDNYPINYCYVGLEKSGVHSGEDEYLFHGSTVVRGSGRLGTMPLGNYDVYVWLGGNHHPVTQEIIPKKLAYIGRASVKENDQEVLIKLDNVSEKSGVPEKNREILIKR